MRYDDSAKLPAVPRFEEPVEQQLAKEPAASPESNLPTPTPHPIATERQPTDSPAIDPLTAVSKPGSTPQTLSDVPSPEKLAHRVEKPPVPDVAKPPRALIKEVRPVIAPTDVPMTFDEREPQVSVDVNELAVRVRGHNLALKELISNLRDETDWPAERLSGALAELTDLADRRAQLTLYRDVVPVEEQKQAGDLASLDAAIALLGAKIFASREQLIQSDGESSEKVAELNDLSRKLAQLASERAQ
jgi:hypothetical protein